MRYRIDLSYDGAEFCGWQIQPHEPSVQEALEKALGTLLRTKVQVTGAGRTDTGVSASCCVAHFDFDGPVPPPLQAPDGREIAGHETGRSVYVPPLKVPDERDVDWNEEARPESVIPLQVPDDLADADDRRAGKVPPVDCKQLRYKLNAILPKSVSINSITPVTPDFHARFGAIRRQYTYYLHRSKDPFCERYSYFFAYPEFDVEAMNRAARLLLGTHDFSCFEKSGGDNKTSVCTVFSARWEPYLPVIHAGTITGGPISATPTSFGPGFTDGGPISATPTSLGPNSPDDGPISATPPSSGPNSPDGEPRYWRFVIEADRFLRNMVRAIVGTLLEVGRGRRPESDFAALILPPDAAAAADASTASGNTSPIGSSNADASTAAGKLASGAEKASRRSEAGESVPGHALFLSGIQYP